MRLLGCFKRLGALFLVLFFAVSGCTDGLVGTQSERDLLVDRRFEEEPASKFRHADLIGRGMRSGVDSEIAGKDGDGLGLIFSISPQAVLERYGILERYRLLERYRILERYEFSHAFDGYAIVVLDDLGMNDYDAFIAELMGDPDIAWFEPDLEIDLPLGVSLESSTNQQIPWSVAAVGGIESWTTSGDGQGAVPVDMYILDTGVSHDDINVHESLAFLDDPAADVQDVDGHGTHVAGIAAAIDDADGLVGVAPGARVHNFKVLGDDGRSDVSVAIAAIEHVIAAKVANPDSPMVMNLSFGEDVGPEATALDVAVESAIAAGISVVVSAGNDGIDANNVTPAHADGVITVGSMSVARQASSFSNFGIKVDLFAPGEGILSLAPGSATPVELSGTSMAAAHVSGAAAMYLALNPAATPAQVKAALLATARTDVLTVPSGTTSRRLWVGPTEENVRDEFSQYNSYNGNNGTRNWSGPWEEINDDGLPTGGNDTEIYIVSNDGDRRLHLGEFKRADNIWTSERGISRAVDLSGAQSARLTFTFRRVSWENDDRVSIQASSDGGATWFEAGSLETIYYDYEWQAAAFDLTPFISANTVVRFLGQFGNDDYFDYVLLDDIQISFGNQPPIVPPGETAPPAPVPVDQPGPVEEDPIVVETHSIGTILDTFPIKAWYFGDEGDASWAGPWIEYGEQNDPDSDEIRVDDDGKCASERNCLSIKTKKTGRGVARPFDLTGALSATLSFDYLRDDLKEPNLHLDVSSNGGATWTRLHTFSPAKDSAPVHASFDISTHISGEMQLRFEVSGQEGDKNVFIDNVQIDFGNQPPLSPPDEPDPVDQPDPVDEPDPVDQPDPVEEDPSVGETHSFGTILDTFPAKASYAGDEGDVSWAGPWVEYGEQTDPDSDEIRVDDDGKCASEENCLRIKTKKTGRGVARPFDLTGASSATLSFDYLRDDLKKPNTHLDVSSDGGATWTRLHTFSPAKDSAPVHASFDISSQISSDMQLRFEVSGEEGDKYVFIDNVRIEF